MTEEEKQDSNLDSSYSDDESKNNKSKIIDEENTTGFNNELSAKDDKNSVLSTVDTNISDDNNEFTKTLEILKENLDENVDDNAVDIDSTGNEDKIGKCPKEEVENDPNFAIICSFFEKFGQNLEIKYSIKNLKTMFEDYTKIRPDLIDLHIKLLRKRRKYINKEKWEKALTRFCTEYSNIDAWELERFGYKNAKLSLRLRILVRLLEAMFDYNQKFKSELNIANEASSLRVPALGRDIIGFTYWYQIDSDLNFRLYKDEPDEEGSWSLVSRNLDELNDCIQELEKKTLEDFKCLSTPNSEESNSNQALIEIPKEIKDDNEQESFEENVKKENACTITEEEIKIKDEIEDEIKPVINDDNQNENNEQEKLVLENESEFSEINSLLDEMLNLVQSDTCLVDLEIRHLYESLLNKIEKNIEESSSKIKNHKPQRRRGRRGRGRKYRNKSNNEIKNPLQNDKCDDLSENKEKTTKSEAKVTKNRKRRSELEKLKEDFAEGLTTKRFSRRIQALQEKKMIEMHEEQKRLEKEMQNKRRKKEAALAAKAAAMLAASLACDKSDDSSDHRKSKRRKKKVLSDDDYQKDSDDDDEPNEKKRKKRKRGKGKRRKGANPWEDSDDSEEEKAENVYEDDYDDILEDDNEELRFDDNEDEFACEEIDPNAEPVVIRRARTVKKFKDDFNDNDFEPMINDDKPCGKCGKYDNPHWILLCDKCDEGYHTSCLRPPLFLIPTGDWFCPPCEHKTLIEKLQIEYKRLSEEFDRRALEKQKQNKRWKFAHCEISYENIIEEENEAENVDNSNQIEIENDIFNEKKVKPYRKRVKQKKPNGYLKDEIQDALDEKDFIVKSDISEDNNDDDNDDNEQSESENDSSSSAEESSESNSSDSDDEIGKYAFSDENNEQIHNKKQRKEKHIDINDYSRSGLKLRSARKRKPISYLFKEYDDLIKSAILQEEGAAEEEFIGEEITGSGMPKSKGKDISNILKANSEMPDFSINPFESNQIESDPNVNLRNDQIESVVKNQNESNNVEIVQEHKDEQPVKKSQRKQQKKKGLTNLDFSDDEEEEDHASDEDFRMADDDEELDEELTEIEEDNPEDDSITESDSDFKSTSRRRSSRIQSRYSLRESRKSKKKRKLKRKFIVDSDEEEDDDISSEEEDDIASDSYSDESSDYAPRTRRAASKKRFSYREASSTEEDEKDDYLDEDYNYYDDEEDSNKPSKNNTKKIESDNLKVKPSVVTYEKENRGKKRINIEDDDEPSNENDQLDKKKVKLDSEQIAPVDEKDKLLINNKKEETCPTIPLAANNETIKSTTTGQQSIEPIATKSSKIVNDSQSSYYPTQSSNVYSKSSDPLDSIKQMNTKFEYTVSSSVAPSSLRPQTPVQSVCTNAPAPYSPSPTLHYQRHPYHPQSNTPYSSPYNPSQTSSASNYPLPPPPQQQYLAQSGPQASYSGSHQMPTHFQQQSTIRPNLPPQNVYNPASLYPQTRYTGPGTSPVTSRSNEKCNDSYTLTNLDSYNKQQQQSNSNYPITTSSPSSTYGQNYTNPQTSPPQILNLDSGNYSSQPTNKPAPPPPPHYYSSPGYENIVRPPGSEYYSTSQTGGASTNFYPRVPPPPPPPSVGIHSQIQRMPYQQQGPPAHYIHRNPSPSSQGPPASSPQAYPPTSNSIPPTTARPPMIPPTSGSYSSPTGATYPYPYPVQNYPQYPASNGGFMIQNILLNRPPVAKQQPQICAVKSAPKATKSVPKLKKTNVVESKELVANILTNQTVDTQPKTKNNRNKKSKGQVNATEAAKI